MFVNHNFLKVCIWKYLYIRTLHTQKKLSIVTTKKIIHIKMSMLIESQSIQLFFYVYYPPFTNRKHFEDNDNRNYRKNQP